MDQVVLITSPTEARRVIGEVTKEVLSNLVKDLQPSEPKTWMTNREAMEYLGVSKATLQRYRSDGRLPFSKVDGLIFYRCSDISAFLDAHMQ